MSAPQIYADFQNLDDENRIKLTCRGTLQDLQRHGIQLREGMHLTFYTDDADSEGRPDPLLLDGIVHFDAAERHWVAAVDWTKLRRTSQAQAKDGAA
jgi:hypothetical protein